MHELSLAQNILELIEGAAKREALKRVTQVFVDLGEQACVEPDALRFCFDLVMRDSVAEGAKLNIANVPGTVMRVRELEVE